MDIFLVATAVGALTGSAGFCLGTSFSFRADNDAINDAVALTDYWMAEAEAAQIRTNRLEVANAAHEKFEKSRTETIVKLEKMIADMTPAYEDGVRYRKSQAKWAANMKARRAAKKVAA